MRREQLVIEGYRRVSWAELLAVIESIDLLPRQAALAITEAVWRCAPPHRVAQSAWSRAVRALRDLRQWLVLVDGAQSHDARLGAVDLLLLAAPHRAEAGPSALTLTGDNGGGARDLSGYAALITMGVDVLRGEGLPVCSAAKGTPGAFEIMSEVLYWVWRKPDARATDVRRTPGSIGAVYWKARKRNIAARLPDRAGLNAAAQGHDGDGFVWIPNRLTARDRRSA